MTQSTGSDNEPNPLTVDHSTAGTFYGRVSAEDDPGEDLADSDTDTPDTAADDAVASGADPDATSSS